MRTFNLTAIISAIAACIIISCDRIDGTEYEQQTITAINEQMTPYVKTVTDDESLSIEWLSGDAINVFFGASESSLFVTNTSGPRAEFKGTISAVTGGGESLTDETSLWGIYPYQNSTTCDGTSITYTLPSVQEAKAGSFADDLWPQIARSRNFYMSFYSLCGSFRFKLYRDDIVKVALSGNQNENLAGRAKVNMPLGGVPVVEEVLEGESVLTIAAPEGECLQSGVYYYFVLFPTEFTESLTLTYYTSESKGTLIGTKSITLGRNKFISFTELDKNLTFEPLEDDGDAESETVLVETIYMVTESVTLAPGTSYTLDTDYEPYNATNTTWEWSSSDASIAYVDDSGKVTAIGDGEITITATATDGSGVSASSTVTVKAITAVPSAEYKDEYGVNHGRGIAIGDVVWAPVNCGYKAPTVDSDGNVSDKSYPYGKLYQWGRKYGQGYSTSYDSTAPSSDDGTIVEGAVKISEGQLETNADIFYSVTTSPYDWALYQNDALWNSGTEAEPKKTQYDPCPDGWRVPTDSELYALMKNYSSWTSDEAQNGRWFSGAYTYQEDAPQVFFSAAGFRYNFGNAYNRGSYGYYWCSRPFGTNANHLYFASSNVFMNHNDRAYGYSVRCVQE